MIIESMIISIVVGYLTGGRLSNIENIRIKYGWMFFTVIFLEFFTLIVGTRMDNGLAGLIVENYGAIHILLYGIYLYALFLNRKSSGFKLIFAGSGLNYIPMVLNGGRMPVYYGALERGKLFDQLDLLLADRMLTHRLSYTNRGIFFLGDIIPLGRPYPMPKVISIGDIILAIGIFIFIVKSMKSGTEELY